MSSGRFPQAAQFAALYGSLDRDQRHKVMGWTKDFESIGDPKTVLVELIEISKLAASGTIGIGTGPTGEAGASHGMRGEKTPGLEKNWR